MFDGWSGGGCSGTGTCTTTVTAATTVTATFNPVYTIGNAAPFPDASSNGPDILQGERVVISSAVTLRQFGLIALAGGPQVKMALYTDNSGTPGSLVAQTAATTLVGGVTLQMNTTTGFVPLAAGTYWIMAVYNATASVGLNTAATGNVVAYRSQPFSSALPTTFGTATTYTGQSFNYYLVVH